MSSSPRSKPVASASLHSVKVRSREDRTTSYDMMAQVSLALMEFVSKELGAVIFEGCDATVRLAEIQRVIREVSDDLDAYRGAIENSAGAEPQSTSISAAKT